jgi:hypothetical protein
MNKSGKREHLEFTFSVLTLLAFGGWVILCLGDCFVSVRGLATPPGLYPPVVRRSTEVTATKNVSSSRQLFPGGEE